MYLIQIADQIKHYTQLSAWYKQTLVFNSNTMSAYIVGVSDTAKVHKRLLSTRHRAGMEDNWRIILNKK